MSIYIDFNAIQSVPSSNINRDDTGNPKTAYYGGYLRARVSSQAWKRAIRTYFGEKLEAAKLGVRTRRIGKCIENAIVEKKPELEDKASEYASAVLEHLIGKGKLEPSKRAGSEKDSGEQVAKYLVFMAHQEIESLADIAIEAANNGLKPEQLKGDEEIDKKIKSIKTDKPQAIDIALFGRMLADIPDMKVDASCQVAHAISVDELAPEYDYFTAVDDYAASDNAGAGYLDTAGFNSATFYRFATVNISSLFEQLNDIDTTTDAVSNFLEAFLYAMPSGKINSFANDTLPSTVLISIRNTRPINLVSAFEDPVRSGNDGSISKNAANRLLEVSQSYNKTYNEEPVKSYLLTVDEAVSNSYKNLESVTLEETLEELKDKLVNEVKCQLNS